MYLDLKSQAPMEIPVVERKHAWAKSDAWMALDDLSAPEDLPISLMRLAARGERSREVLLAPLTCLVHWSERPC